MNARGDTENDVDDERRPDPDATVLHDDGERSGEGAGETDEDARSSLQPGADTKRGPKSDTARAQPYDEQPIGLRMHEQPLETDGHD